jgi:hypothetical protein
MATLERCDTIQTDMKTKIAFILFLVSCFGFLGCASTESASHESCPKHGMALHTRSAYRLSEDIDADPIRSYIRVADDYPKHTPWFYSAKRTEIHRKREKVSFCPKCDAELREALRKSH